MSTKLKAGTATSGAVLDADATGVLELQSGSTPTTAITVDTSQNVGVGTASPITKLDVRGIVSATTTVAGNGLVVTSNSQGSGQGGQIKLVNSYPSATNPNKYIRVDDVGTLSVVNSAYSATILDVTNAGILNTNGYKKGGTTISSIVYADVNISGMTTSYATYLFTLPNGIEFTSVVNIQGLNGVNDICYVQAYALGEWSGVQARTQARVTAALGNAVASSTGTIRVWYTI